MKYSGEAYKWMDGEAFDFNNFGQEFPKNQECVFMKDNGEWNDASCSSVRSYICKKDESERFDS